MRPHFAAITLSSSYLLLSRSN